MSTTGTISTQQHPQRHSCIRLPSLLESLSQQDAYHEGYVNYQQACLLGHIVTSQSLSEVMATTILDVYHPSEHNSVYLLGWIAAYLDRDKRENGSLKQNLKEASRLLEDAMLRVTREEAEQ